MPFSSFGLVHHVFIEARRLIEHKLLKDQGEMLTFIAKLCNLTMIELFKAFFLKNTQVTAFVTQSVKGMKPRIRVTEAPFVL